MLEPDPRPRQVNEIRERSSDINLDAVGALLVKETSIFSIETEQGTQSAQYTSGRSKAYALEADCLVVETYDNSHRYELYESFAAKNTSKEATDIENKVEELVDQIYPEKI